MGVVVIVGTTKGMAVARAGEKRDDWQVSALRAQGWLVTAATRDAGGRYYVGVTHDVWGSALLASDDLESWEQLESAPRYAPGLRGNEAHNRVIGASDPMGQYAEGGRYVDQIWKLHALGNTVYAGVSEAGLFRSDDRGKSWDSVEGFNEHPSRPSWGPGFGGLCAHTVLVDERNPDRLWVGVSAAGAFRSEDGGRTWVPANEGVSKGEDYCVHAMAHDPQRAEILYRQDHRGVYRSDDAGDTWRSIENGLPVSHLGDEHDCVFGFAIEMDPKSGSVFVIPLTSDSFRFPHEASLIVYRTQDGGESWQPLAKGLPRGCYANVLRGAMSVDSLDPCGVYFGTTNGSLYGSADRGESWRELARDLPKILSVDAFEE